MNPGRTFALEIGSDGAASLQKVILKKLTEFMGDYTDDVLAQYVLVLVAHGKQQAQAAKDLEAFLGDQSESFVAWLWNYLCSNLHLHASVSKASIIGSSRTEQKLEQTDNGTAKGVQSNVQILSSNHMHGEKTRNDPSSARVLPDLNDPPPKITNSDNGVEIDKHESNERSGSRHSRHSAKRQRIPMDTPTQKERKHSSDVKRHRKRCVSPLGVNATRRLLQSAVREAVAPVASLAKSGSKRLRSVVSTDVDNSMLVEETNKAWEYKDVDDVRQGNATVRIAPADTKAHVSVSNDAIEAKGSLVGSVWDRLGTTARDMKEDGFDGERDSYLPLVEDSRFFSGDLWPDDEVGNDGAFVRHKSRLMPHYFSRVNGYMAEDVMGERPAKARGRFFSGDLWPDDEVGNDGDFMRHKSRLMPHYFSRVNGFVAEDVMGERPAKARRGSQHQENAIREQHEKTNDRQAVLPKPPSKLAKSSTTELREPQKETIMLPSSMQLDASQKHVVCLQGQEPATSQLDLPQTEVSGAEGDSHKSVLEIKKRLDQVGMEMLKLRAKHSESNKELSSTTSGTEQIQKAQDSLQKRTVFVTNIHFAATKDSVAAHFAQCGKVEQVVLLMERATGKPKGSAYVEFSMEDDAEKALGLNETSFFSRILKIVRPDATIIQDMQSNQARSIRHANPPIPSISSTRSTRGWGFRGSFNPVPGFSSLRGAGYGAPTRMQWKRDSVGGTGGSTTASNGSKSGQGPPARSMAKSFTYVRNPNASAGAVDGEKGAK